MLFAGLRRFEVAGLTGRDIQPDGGRFWLNLTTTKGGKPRRVKIHDTLYKSIMAWRNVAGNVFGDDTPIFLSDNKGDNIQNTPIADNVIERIVREYAQAAELVGTLGRKLAPHDLRRTCARNAYDNGATLLQVQQMLGHSDPKTTSRYIGADFNDDDTAVDRLKY
jgi:integrase